MTASVFPRLLRSLLLVGLLFAAARGAQPPAAPAAAAGSPSIVFVGNSFLFATGSPVRFYRASTVTDLNGTGFGGVPALFKAFADQAGRDFAVSHETSSGKNLDFHLNEKAEVLTSRPWDHAVLLGMSLLDRARPGNPELLVNSARDLAALLHRRNPQMDIRLIATWARADQIYPAKGHWHGKDVAAMTRDIRAGYDLALAASPHIRGIIPVGQAWLRAMQSGFADPNPYDGIAPNQVSLWTYDHYHGSTFGYYLEALVIFGDLTGLDPRSLGEDERAAYELGLSKPQASALQKIAAEELLAAKGHPALKPFTPRPLPLP
ncbi:MAG: hypothetical protein B9S34_13765 [Opitutia bacterium Tous-C1TDCM]|nr:MAG: hypothetical protein B9S34_13765 [Opitutae bacterium Tous-C1TDCM]